MSHRDLARPSPAAFFSPLDGHHHHLHSFPTRRSPDLGGAGCAGARLAEARHVSRRCRVSHLAAEHRVEDRKSTRLNSSHLVISYAVFCLEKKSKSDRNL